MKAILVCMLVIICLAKAQTDVALPFSVRMRSNRAEATCTAASDGWTCKNCDTFLMCDGADIEYEVNCKDQNPARPYCNSQTNTCDADINVCPPEPINFKCKTTGYFPDPNFCNRYIYCTKNLQPMGYACVLKGVYEHNKQRCISGAACYQFTQQGLCKGNTNKLVAYPPDPSLYVFCAPTGNVKLKSCSSKNYIMDKNTGSCEFVCNKGEGQFPDDKDPKAYFVCVKDGSVIKPVPQKCPNGFTFDKDAAECEPDDNGAANTNSEENVSS